jgi:hypothetical protein
VLNNLICLITKGTLDGMGQIFFGHLVNCPTSVPNIQP